MEIAVPENFDDLVELHIKVRDRIDACDKAHKEKLKPIKDLKEQLEAKMLQRLLDIGAESTKTRAGTVYRSTKRNASIADGDTFRKFVQDNELFDLVDWKANAPAVADYIDEHQAPPPGVNFSTTFTVGVRRK
jgi:hypothetical protein